MSTNTTEMDALKARLKSTWMSGDYAHFATYLTDGAMDFLASSNIPPGAKVLDVACGAGQTAIPMARQGVNVTGVDIATNLIEAARKRARDEGLPIRFDEGDAEELPYEDASFDVVISLIGAMFAPQPQKVAAEMARVCRPGGRIIMGNWTPGGFVGQMFKAIASYIAPPGMPSPVLWGDESIVRQRLSAGIADVRCVHRLYRFDYPFSPADVVEFFRVNYGPMSRAFDALDADRQRGLRRDLVRLWTTNNMAEGDRTQVDAEYLEVIATRA